MSKRPSQSQESLPLLRSHRRSWAEIDLGAIRENLQSLLDFGYGAGDPPNAVAVLKANAYGHGLREVAAAVEPMAHFAGVANLDEALSIFDIFRDGSRILLLSAVLPNEREEVVNRGFVPVLSTCEEALAFAQVVRRSSRKQPLAVHLSVDTGMGRMGFLEEELLSALRTWKADFPELKVDGICSHCPSADEDQTFTQQQIVHFGLIVKNAKSHVTPRWIHLANSAGGLGFPTMSNLTNIVRSGIFLFGAPPIFGHAVPVRPALTWKTQIILLRDLPPGHGISYGREFFTNRKPSTRVATLGVGYGDGLPRSISNRGEVLIGGCRCPILGRVTMDQIMVDVSEVNQQLTTGDDAVILGRQGNEEITADELARNAGTISWEIFCGITSRVSRHYRSSSPVQNEIPLL